MYITAGSVFFRTTQSRVQNENPLRLGTVSFGVGAVTVRTNVKKDSKRTHVAATGRE